MAFEMLQCRVALAGKQSMVVHKVGVTPAHIVVLRRIHGENAVSAIAPVPQHLVTPRMKLRGRHTMLEEFNYLAREFGAYSTDADGVGNEVNVVAAIWPGMAKALPTKVSDIPVVQMITEQEAPDALDGADLDAVPEQTWKAGAKDPDAVPAQPKAQPKSVKGRFVKADVDVFDADDPAEQAA